MVVQVIVYVVSVLLCVHFRAIVLLQCCHIVVLVIAMLVRCCVYCLCLWWCHPQGLLKQILKKLLNKEGNAFLK